MTAEQRAELIALAERVERADPWLLPYLKGWWGDAEPQPWGAAMSFALEVAHSYGLILGELDTTPTAKGVALRDHLRALAAQDEQS